LKFFNKKTLLLVFGFAVLLVIGVAGGALIYISSPAFKEKARLYAVAELERDTGGRVTLGRLYWNLWTRRVSILDLTIHGMEPADAAPLAHIESIEAGVSFRSLLKQKIDLFELTVTRPEFHVTIDSAGNTNLPNPPPRDYSGLSNYQLNIENFTVAQGMAFVNERQIQLDFILRDLASDLSYHSVNRILTAHLSYNGVLQRPGSVAIPYGLAADFDYTRGTLLAKHIVVSSAKSQLQLQGRINDVLTSRIAGQLSYSGNAALTFLNYLFPREKFAGEAALAGALEFSKASFSTHGSAKSAGIGFEAWNVSAVSSAYDYRYPERRLVLDNVSADAFGGSAQGKITVDALPGPSRLSLNLAYKDIDGSALARLVPLDPMYRLESRISGSLQGWFEGRMDRFEFAGDAALTAAVQKDEAGIIALPVDGSLGFALKPGHAQINNGNFHFLSTSLQADGPLDTNNLTLRVHLDSSNLADLKFLYSGANGTGSFDGVVGGPFKTPRADGTLEIRNYRYREWTIQQVFGMASLDMAARTATLDNLRVVQGQSQITLNGTTTLDGAKMDLRIQTPALHAADVEPFVKQQFGGVLSGAIHLTSLMPLRFEGDVRGMELALKGQTVRDLQSHVLYNAPTLTLQNLAVSDGGSTLSGRVVYNTTSEAMTFTVHISSVDLARLRNFGLPEAVAGRIQQADLTGSGSPRHPQVEGNARLQNLSFHGETFPAARIDLSTEGTKIDLKLSETQNLTLSAEIDTAKAGNAFTAQAAFKSYSIEHLAGFSRGSLVVSGNATLRGSLNDLTHVSGEGNIDPIEIVVQDQSLKSTKPFAFDFNAERLNITDLALVSAKNAQQVNVSGTVGLTSGAKLDLKVTGQVDAGLLASNPWSVAGSVSLNCQIRGTVAKPDVQGQASFSDLSVARQGVTTSLTSLKGDVVFDEHRMTLNDVEGRSGGGTIQLQGTGAIEGDTIGALNLRIDASGVRLRYPTGMRSVIDGMLTVGGTLAAPSVNGDLQIQSLTFNSSFDDFLALFESAGTAFEGNSPFGNTKLSLRVIGNRNISIHNELASAEAIVDLGIKGTIDRPSLTGHVETSNGTLLFQGKSYDVTRGNIDFVDPVRIDPNINIQAETTVRSYQVFLSISGKIDRLQLNMRSEPPLPQLEIVNLISGGKTTDELAQSAKASTTPTGEQVFQGGAASILSDMLLSRVGSKFNLLGLDRALRIDPYSVGAQNSTTARITLSKQLTKDLSVTYSSELSTNKQQIIQIEYFVTKNLSVLASKDEDDVRALDLRIRKRF
jgi:translocation and assembly module TamB